MGRVEVRGIGEEVYPSRWVRRGLSIVLQRCRL